MKKRLTAYLLLLLTAALWGWAAPIVKYTLSFISPISFLFYRFVIVSLIFLIPFLVSWFKKPITLKELTSLLFIGLLGGPATLILIFVGAERTTSLNSSIIVAMAPILIVIAGALFLKEKIIPKENLGLVLALAGTLVTVLEPIAEGIAFSNRYLIGNLLTFGSNIAWAAYVILAKKQFHKQSHLIVTALTFFSGLIVLLPLFIYQNKPVFNVPRQAVPGILYMAIFSSVIAYTTHNWGTALIEASEASLFTYLQPVFAAPLAYFWLKEKITLPFWIGALLIAIGVYLTESRKEFSRTNLK